MNIRTRLKKAKREVKMYHDLYYGGIVLQAPKIRRDRLREIKVTHKITYDPFRDGNFTRELLNQQHVLHLMRELEPVISSNMYISVSKNYHMCCIEDTAVLTIWVKEE